ncbi:glycosyltransferase family 4 protein [Actinomycetospora chibensis]|uniref:Glycosyltransferase family 4 protein n=1 Tax=Actinomycetospora chibensis TaxID=663606 RepID=A0ABV9RI77_9PSEU|nr:glycosyltransferase family 4 protein [Actinomycetospora chibensis]MDD7923283.1 glycosyltransferase family 4 protein [Actinomycetospora chibensis]
MIKALFVTHTAAPSGAELHLVQLVAALRNVEVATAFTEDGPIAERMRAHGVETTIIRNDFDSRAMTIAGSGPVGLVKGFFALLRLGSALGSVTRRSAASVLVAESTKALVMGAVAARVARVPLVWQVRDRISAEYFGRALAPLVRVFGWAVSDAYIANSRSTLSSLIRWRKPALVAYPGVEIDGGRPRPSQRSPEKTVVVVVGRLTRWKGQDVFLRALAEVAVRPAHVYLVGGTFFGEEPFRDELQRLAGDLGLPVTFTGHVDDPTYYMRQADILVHCSVIAEPFGTVVVEGMNAGCAVIASQPGGPTEVVEPGVNGLLVDAGDRAQLTAALDQLIGDPDLRRRLSSAAPARAAHFDVNDAARDVAGFLDALVATSHRGGVMHVRS